MADWDGAGYEQISDLQRELAQRTLATLRFAGTERLLDVGCGDGFITRSIAARLPEGSVVGIDGSPRMIEVARAKPDPEGSRLRFLVADVLALPFADEFDVAVSFNVLHWLVDQRAALASIAAAIHPSGRILVQQVCAGRRPSLEQLAMAVCRRPGWRDAFDGFAAPFLHVEPDGYRQIAAAAGLRVTDLRVEDVEWDFGSRAAFAQWCTVGFADWTARLSPAQVPQWVDDVVSDYQDLVGRDGLFRFMQLRAQLTHATG